MQCNTGAISVVGIIYRQHLPITGECPVAPPIEDRRACEVGFRSGSSTASVEVGHC